MLLRDNVYDALRSAILTCELQPGQDLREQDLAARYAVSRSPIRDALLRLEGERLVTVLPRQGYRVNAVSFADARDIFGLRLVIEPACAAAAAEAGGAEAGGAEAGGAEGGGAEGGAVEVGYRAALAAFRGHAGGETDFVAYNRGFHAAIADLSGNARMAAVARDLVEQSDRLVRVSLQAIGDLDRGQLVAEHEAIIDAIQSRDSAAAAALARLHVAAARTRVLTALKASAQATASKAIEGNDT